MPLDFIDVPETGNTSQESLARSRSPPWLPSGCTPPLFIGAVPRLKCWRESVEISRVTDLERINHELREALRLAEERIVQLNFGRRGDREPRLQHR
jgi:hypothetical protein